MNARLGLLLCLALAVTAAATRLRVDVCETYSSDECREHLDHCTPCRVRRFPAQQLSPWLVLRAVASARQAWIRPLAFQLPAAAFACPLPAGLGPRRCVLRGALRR